MDTSEVQETLQAGDLDNEPHTNHYLEEKAWLWLKRHTNRDVDTHSAAVEKQADGSGISHQCQINRLQFDRHSK